jgi:hypothetical protein
MRATSGGTFLTCMPLEAWRAAIGAIERDINAQKAPFLVRRKINIMRFGLASHGWTVWGWEARLQGPTVIGATKEKPRSY